jgi:hypothetical protein
MVFLSDPGRVGISNCGLQHRHNERSVIASADLSQQLLEQNPAWVAERMRPAQSLLRVFTLVALVGIGPEDIQEARISAKLPTRVPTANPTPRTGWTSAVRLMIPGPVRQVAAPH